MKIYTLVDNDTQNGLTIYTFRSKDKAEDKLTDVLKEYHKVVGEFHEDSELHTDWADIIMDNGEHAGTVSIMTSYLT